MICRQISQSLASGCLALDRGGYWLVKAGGIRLVDVKISEGAVLLRVARVDLV